ncbi:hypothetical protein ABZV60_31970 [Streptomyces sp. NPDC004787]|uniref:hypothetical protein n=1 Tax=Streptomyces sp. NPDC004787 TaxID=3154291 RepID=UPI0033B4B2D4
MNPTHLVDAEPPNVHKIQAHRIATKLIALIKDDTAQAGPDAKAGKQERDSARPTDMTQARSGTGVVI